MIHACEAIHPEFLETLQREISRNSLDKHAVLSKNLQEILLITSNHCGSGAILHSYTRKEMQ